MKDGESKNKAPLDMAFSEYRNQLSDAIQRSPDTQGEHLDGYYKILEYLASKGSMHHHYRHYVSRSRAESILEQSAIYLTDGSSWNDIFDYQHFNPAFSSYRHFGSCFSASTDESIAMWMLYGGPHRDGVMFDFTREILNKAINETPHYEGGYFDEGHFQKIRDIPRNLLELRLVDILYFRELNNGDDANISVRRIGDSKRVDITRQELESIPQLTKHVAWSYEKEVRLVARIKRSDYIYNSKITCIKIPLQLSQSFVETRVFDSPLYSGRSSYSDSCLHGTVKWNN
ncbi:DUF2971 domain-containing protein [Tractidigestivibacter scatoligenes]|uniref:DUF2971 domain-containing protein n=1 Tax=Tractidigestivibacter scatoligenes TaxID=1299998 RepID=UPI0009E88C11|nr:DUF2971 domain-containing protein [Tractidigestivibacter scatoligenes]